MKTSIWMKGLLATAGSALIGLLLATVSHAATESVVAEVTFADPVTIVEVGSLRYGVIDQILNTETLIIAPDSTVTGTGTGLLLGGTQAAADLTVTASNPQNISIQVGTIVDGTGYALSGFTCNYDGGTDTACQAAPLNTASAASAQLLIGATLTGDNLAVVGAADGSFIVTITYQ